MSFDESRIDPEHTEGSTSGGPGFNTIIVTGSGGGEQRIPLLSSPRHDWTLAYTPSNPQKMYALLYFFTAHMGKAIGFRFQDITDFQAWNELLVNGGTTKLQLIKTYTCGAFGVVRTIKKPVFGTVSLYKDGVLMVNGFSLDITTGIVTLAVAAPASVFTWTGEFDTPVRFDVDKMTYTHVSVGERAWDTVPIIELTAAEIAASVSLIPAGMQTIQSGSQNSSGMPGPSEPGGSGMSTDAPSTTTIGYTPVTSPTLMLTSGGLSSYQSGGTVVLSVAPATGGTPPYAYQFQVSADSGMTFTDVAGATMSTMTTPVTGDLYRVKVTDSTGATSLTMTMATPTLTMEI